MFAQIIERDGVKKEVLSVDLACSECFSGPRLVRMCGLGRHGWGTLFLSETWDLSPNAVTFGKVIEGGVFPLSRAVIRTGASLLGRRGRSVMQSHTFAGSSWATRGRSSSTTWRRSARV